MSPSQSIHDPLKTRCQRLIDTFGSPTSLLLVQIPQFDLDSFDPIIARKGGYPIFPPTGLQFLHEAIRQRRLQIHILDLNYELLKKVHEEPDFIPKQRWRGLLLEALERLQPDMTGVSCLFDFGLPLLTQAMETIREYGKTITLCGGVAPSYQASALLNANLVHFVIQGEGENKLGFLLDHLTAESWAIPDTPGIYFIENGAIHQTQGPMDLVHFQGNLIASYDLVPIERYHHYGSLNPFSRLGGDLGSRSFAVLQMSRGCRARCTFCAVHAIMGKGVRFRPVHDVLAEMRFLYWNRGIRHFEWLDDDLLFHRAEFQDLLRRIIASDMEITWSANNGLIATSIDHETVSLMDQSGCIGFKIGIETGNRELFRKVKKPGRHENFIHVSHLLLNHPKLFAGGNIIIGLPGETFAMMMDSLRFSLEVKLDWIAFTVCQAIRGAKAFGEEILENDDPLHTQNLGNFIPTRNTSGQQLHLDGNIKTGYDLFSLDPGLVPNAAQIKEIWFVFNLLVNYIHHKNLQPEGHVGAFLFWVETARKAYPNNPVMALFLFLAKRINHEHHAAVALFQEVIKALESPYWQTRFQQFDLNRLLEDPPKDRETTFRALAWLRETSHQKMVTTLHPQDVLTLNKVIKKKKGSGGLP
ncbi:MAG: B12-binding domain-containing radical SAM protein, partial [Nitrospirae bacterium]|nr:B12-binding domain-containing radical SAM protein [Magnetococcales bacterium]